MKTQKLSIALTAVNLFILLTLFFFFNAGFKPSAISVLRGNALEIVDEKGQVRAEIKILPADPSVKMPDGSVGYPESVLLRLIDSGGGPNVKISATDDGAGLVLGGESGYVQILSRNVAPKLKLSNKDGKEYLIELK